MILVYLLSNLNYIILSTARSERRRKEIGLKKIFGLQKNSLISQMVIETVIITIFALLVSLLLIKLFLPQINTFFNKEVMLALDIKLVLFILASIIITVLISLSYLGIYLSSFRAIDLLSGIRVKYLKQNVSKIITPLQMIISFFFIMSFLCILLQLRYMKHKDKGIDISNIIGIKSTGFIYDFEAFKNELLNKPEVISITASGLPPVDYNFGKFDIRKEYNGDVLDFVIMSVDPDYIKTFEIEMSEGEFLPGHLNMKAYFDRKYAEYNPVVLNQTAMELLEDVEIGDYIYMGKLRSKMKIVGVMKDFHFVPLDKKIDPVVMYYNPENFLEFYIRISPENTNETIKYIEGISAEFRKGKYSFDYYFMEDMLKNQYSSELNMARMATFITIISFCITLFGLGGMTYYSLIRKRKSISIRKVFGAGSKDITIIFLKETGIIMVLSFIVSFLLTQLLMENWLNNYSYRINMPYAYFSMIFLLVAFLVGLLVTLIVRNESNKNPVVNLRDE
jgi:putative ABC transport system permease protein